MGGEEHPRRGQTEHGESDEGQQDDNAIER
jgi:hypothetical protein